MMMTAQLWAPFPAIFPQLNQGCVQGHACGSRQWGPWKREGWRRLRGSGGDSAPLPAVGRPLPLERLEVTALQGTLETKSLPLPPALASPACPTPLPPLPFSCGLADLHTGLPLAGSAQGRCRGWGVTVTWAEWGR